MLAQTPPRDVPAVVRLLYPTAGMTLGLDGVHFEATALDPDGGPLTQVEFLAGDQVVAVSDRSGDVFPTVVGLAVAHKAVWTKATVGVHVIRAQAVVRGEVVAQSDPVKVVVQERVEPPPPPTPPSTNGPLVGLTAMRPTTSEPSPLVRIAPGLVTVTRWGDLSEPMKIRYAIGGTASNGVDYQFLNGELTLEAGEAVGEIEVMPADDEEAEPSETVILKVLPDPAYQLSPAYFAVVTILDANEPQTPLPPRDVPAVVRLLHPMSGMTLGLDAVHFEATALDPDGGPLTRVEFLAGNQVVAVSDRSGDFFPTVLGLAVPHKAAWTNATVGLHVIRARAVVQGQVVAQSDSVRIMVKEKVEPPPPPTPTNGPWVGFMATRPTTSEPSPSVRMAPGLVTVTRRGDLSEPLKVRYAVGGTASNGVDYQFLDGDLTLGAGEAVGEIQVMPIDDEDPEPSETVILKVLPDPAYQLSAAYSAVVTILNANDRPVSSLRMVSPRSGTLLTAPARIRVELDAVDPQGYIPKVEFLTNGVSAGVSRIEFIQAPPPGAVLRHAIEWEAKQVGGYEVTAMAVDSQGRLVKASPIRLTVRDPVEPQTTPRHPADVSPEDGVITRDEVEAYAKAWRSADALGGRRIPMAFVTRAGFLAKAGDGYVFDPARGALPLAWASTNPQAEPRPGIDFLPPFGAGGVMDFGTNAIPPRMPLSHVLAEFPRFAEPGEYTVRVQTGPVAGTRSHAVELYLYGDVEFSAASDDGVFDAANRVVRWGPFHDEDVRRMTVTWKAAGDFKMKVAGSFDGRDGMSATIPQAPLEPGSAAPPPRIATLESMDNGGVQLVVLGGAAGSEMDVEVSTDLVRWVRIARGATAAEAGAMVTVDGDAGEVPVRFYRAVPRGP